MNSCTLLAGIATFLVGVYFANPRHGPEDLCLSKQSGPGLDFELTLDGQQLELSICDFSEDYLDARSKFRAAAKAAQADVTTLTVVPGSDYTMDIAVVRGTSGLVVHSSGVHGAEGYAGSAIQIAALRAFGARPPSATVVLVHAVNPYGMAHMRRFNENNVDLNRNGLHPEGWKRVMAREPNIAHYDDFEQLFNPKHPPSYTYAYIKLWLQLPGVLLQHGIGHLKKAMVSAQYHNPLGIFFGGQSLQPSHNLLSEFLESRGFLDAGGTVSWVDVHTGLGSSGKDTLMVSGGQRMPEVNQWFPGADSIQDMSRSSGGDVAAGYELTVGTVEQFYEGLFPATSKALVVTQEFGTLPSILVARAMILENMAFNHDKPNQPEWSVFTRDAFYVRTRDWRRSVLTRGLSVLMQATQRSSPSTPPN